MPFILAFKPSVKIYRILFRVVKSFPIKLAEINCGPIDMPSTSRFGRRGIASPDAPPKAAGDPGLERQSGSSASSFVGLLFSFEGRVPRLSYWLSQIGCIIVSQLVAFLCRILNEGLHRQGEGASASLGIASLVLIVMLILLGVLALAFWISLTFVVRRWHDRDKSGAWALLGFIPIIGWMWQGIECGFLEGSLGPNRYGPSPKGITGVTFEDFGPAPVA
ncbi:DUF805 domain-containing protein [Phenylobacterium montanum]|uniref:DUF805 domain-containing protein n=1 Tax=Phenylobacterium montanum TaxID=2823693 RepID=A0A975IWR3_9CAUL|nr:DUF805 domain-containing protein [Caulobacter sp. S6]QUD89864.1 DUF805 domain-containing protein [Caulobacter sp. S6]